VHALDGTVKRAFEVKVRLCDHPPNPPEIVSRRLIFRGETWVSQVRKARFRLGRLSP